MRSHHAKNLDPDLNKVCLSVAGCLGSTNVENIYLLSGIAPPAIRRDVCARVERTDTISCQVYSLQTSQQKSLDAAAGGGDCARDRTYFRRDNER